MKYHVLLPSPSNYIGKSHNHAATIPTTHSYVLTALIQDLVAWIAVAVVFLSKLYPPHLQFFFFLLTVNSSSYSRRFSFLWIQQFYPFYPLPTRLVRGFTPGGLLSNPWSQTTEFHVQCPSIPHRVYLPSFLPPVGPLLLFFFFLFRSSHVLYLHICSFLARSNLNPGSLGRLFSPLPCLLLLFFPFLSFSVFFFLPFFSLLSFPLSSLFFVSFFYCPNDLRLSCVCVVSLSWVAKRYSRFFQARVMRRTHRYGPGTS